MDLPDLAPTQLTINLKVPETQLPIMGMTLSILLNPIQWDAAGGKHLNALGRLVESLLLRNLGRLGFTTPAQATTVSEVTEVQDQQQHHHQAVS